MKKLLLILTAALLIISFTACSNSKPADTQVSGGWTLHTDTVSMSMSDDAMQAFNKAVKDVKDVTYSPVALLGTQVVSGTNYAFLVIEKSGDTEAFKVLIIYSDLNGNAEIIKKSDFNVEKYTQGEGSTPDQGLSGGWSVDPDTAAQPLPEDAQKAFDAAVEGLTGNSLTPLALLATQVVSGTNYAILCMGTTVTEEPVSTMQVVTIYEDTEGKSEITNIHTLDIAEFNV